MLVLCDIEREILERTGVDRDVTKECLDVVIAEDGLEKETAGADSPDVAASSSVEFPNSEFW